MRSGPIAARYPSDAIEDRGETMPKISEIAHDCIGLWNEMRHRDAYERHYSDDAVKVEPVNFGDDYANEVRGRKALADHEEYIWERMVHAHSITIAEGPYIGASGFSVVIDSDFTMRDTGERHVFREIGVYTVKDGKIVREEFLYDEVELGEANRMNEDREAAANE